MNNPQIAPSLLAADFARLAAEIDRVEQGGADLLHLDVMDGHFVPNISFGLPVVAAVRKVTGLELDRQSLRHQDGQGHRRRKPAGVDLVHGEETGAGALDLEGGRRGRAGVHLAEVQPARVHQEGRDRGWRRVGGARVERASVHSGVHRRPGVGDGCGVVREDAVVDAGRGQQEEGDHRGVLLSR